MAEVPTGFDQPRAVLNRFEHTLQSYSQGKDTLPSKLYRTQLQQARRRSLRKLLDHCKALPSPPPSPKPEDPDMFDDSKLFDSEYVESFEVIEVSDDQARTKESE
jgi:hypothetical protein